ncbi:MAG: translocation/assembly module TamB domain-containing protein [Rikenellaceae bacterium]
MRKVTKILAKLLSATILLLIILPLTLSLALTLPAVQNYVVRQAAHYASDYLDAKVEVGGVHFSLLREFVVSDLLIEDHGGDTMLYTKHLAARLSTLSLLSKDLHISSLALSDGEFHLRELEAGVMNVKSFVDRLTNPEGDGSFRTAISSISFERFELTLERLAKSTLKGDFGVDLNNMSISGANARISNFVSHDRITELSVDHFDGVEQSGLSISLLSTNLVTYTGVVDFIDLNITTKRSILKLPKLRLESDEWEAYQEFNSKVSVDLVSDGTLLSLGDVAYFAPELRGNPLEVRGLSFVANGTVDHLETYIKSMLFGDHSSLDAKLSIEGITDPLSAKFDISLNALTTNAADINAVAVGFGMEPLDDSTMRIAERLGEFDIIATAEGSAEEITLDATLQSQLGELRYKGVVDDATTLIKVQGELLAKNFALGRLIDNSTVGALTASSKVSYAAKDKGMESIIDGSITSLGYNSSLYSQIDFEGSFDGESLSSSVVSRDPKFDFDLAALLQLGEQRHYDVTLRVNRVDLVDLAINKRDSISRASGSMRVNLSGDAVDNLSGAVTLRNVNYLYNEESIYAPIISITARNSAQSKYINLSSDFLDMTFNSKSSFEGLYDYLNEGFREYIPMLYNDHKERKEGRKVTIANNYSTLKVDFKNISPLTNAISTGFNVADNSSFNLMVNPHSERFSLRFESDYIEHRNLAATELNINASNDLNSLSLYATASDLFVGRTSFSSCTLMAGARNNEVELSTGFRDIAASRSATMGLRAKFEKADSVVVSLLPSQVSLGEDMWMISANEILEVGSNLYIDNFTMVNGAQRLSLDGVISKDPSESLILQLDNYDIGMITSVINDLGYDVNGLSSGYIYVSQILGSPRVVAEVELNDVDVNSIPSPPLRLDANWDTKENKAGVYVTNRDNRDTVMTGYYAPSDNRYYANLKVDSLNMALITPLLATTITDTHGLANVDVSLQGVGKQASLHGGIDIYDMSTRVIFTQVEYLLPSAHIDVDDNILSSKAQRFYDRDGNSGLITLNLSLDHLSNVSYSMRVVPDNMMVLNTTERDNELFYGTLYASGVAVISGDKRGVNMDITATSKPNSSFYMPLSTKSAIAKTDFITFVQQQRENPDQGSSVNFRKSYIEERNRRLNTAGSQSVNVTMAIQATPDVDFQLVIDPVVGDVIKAKGEGRLNLNIAPQENLFEMYGDYNITEGNYLFTLLNPISKRFVIESGSSIQWNGDPIDPMLDIDAIYKVKTSLDPLINSTSDYSSESSSRAVPVDCIIEIGDRLSQPSVNFNIEVPTADTEQQAVIANTLIDQETISQQFFYLMFANSFISTSSSSTSLLSSSTASTGFELLTNQLSNWLSSSTYNWVIRYRPESELTSDEVDLGFSRGLIDNRLLIEVEGNYLADNKTMDDSNFSNFMGEAYVTWLIDKAGALRLKGFTQTIDRYDENQGLQETGIGIYYSESFDTFRELTQKIRERFRRKKRSEEDEENLE